MIYDVTDLGKFIINFAKKINRTYPSNCADIEDYIQTGYLKLLELNKCGHYSFGYAIVSIAREMKLSAIGSMLTVYAPNRVKELIRKIRILFLQNHTELEICELLGMSKQDVRNLQVLITSMPLHKLFDELTYNLENFSVLKDIMSSRLLTQDDKVFIQSQIDNDNQNLSRKQKWIRNKNLRSKLLRSGYGE